MFNDARAKITLCCADPFRVSSPAERKWALRKQQGRNWSTFQLDDFAESHVVDFLDGARGRGSCDAVAPGRRTKGVPAFRSPEIHEAISMQDID